MEGRNILTGPEVDPANFGSTFWTSPQSDWEWPPPPEVDHQPYRALAVDGGVLCVGSLSPRLGVLISKRFFPLLERDGFGVEYSIHNQGPAPVRMAPWEITRVAGGLTAFASGAGRIKHPILPEPAVNEFGGVTWFQYDRAAVTCDQKLFAHSSAGWLVHVEADLALIKEFDVVSPEQQAPGEAAIEIFASGLKDYIEIEQQGPFDVIEVGAKSVWQVNWLLRRVPRDLARAGNTEFISWVQRELAR